MRLSVILLAGTLPCLPAIAQEEPGSGRFELQPSANGFIRLDTETGAVSHCSRGADGVWFCDIVVEDQGALGKRVDELSARVDELSRQVEALAARVAEPPPPPVAASPPAADGGGFADTVLSRLFEMVRRMKLAGR